MLFLAEKSKLTSLYDYHCQASIQTKLSFATSVAMLISLLGVASHYCNIIINLGDLFRN